ncbi:MAG: bifunctional oligoribonuclease/PAP phosphatase NrnA [Bacilli bacterium]|nr:bifunctional oligoribonuclease/PAP phosphatase NrnA [Bacilli bacterium]
MFKKILEKIKEYDTIIIHRHMRPDGDCIGSQMGLKYLLKASFPNKNIYAVGDDIPTYLRFLGENDVISDDTYKGALVISVDTSVDNRIYDNRYNTGDYFIKIDHHDDSPEFADMEYVDEKMSACCGIITEFYLANKDELVMTKEAATALYTGILTDTGRFQFRGVDHKILRCASVLMEYDVDNEKINTILNTKDIRQLKLQAYIYNHLKCTKEGIYYMIFTKRVMKKFNVTPEEAAANVNLFSNIEGSIIWATFVEYPENIRVRLRSRYIAINEVARKYRGGGHLFASGATVYNKKEIKEVLAELDKLIVEYKAKEVK